MPPVGKRGFGGKGCYDAAADIVVEVENENDNDNEINVNIEVNVDGDGDESGDSGDGKKLELCHEGKTINVSESAVPAHLEHGDTLGPCPDPVIGPEADVEPVNLVTEPVIDQANRDEVVEPDTGSAETDVGGESPAEDPV